MWCIQHDQATTRWVMDIQRQNYEQPLAVSKVHWPILNPIQRPYLGIIYLRISIEIQNKWGLYSVEPIKLNFTMNSQQTAKLLLDSITLKICIVSKQKKQNTNHIIWFVFCFRLCLCKILSRAKAVQLSSYLFVIEYVSLKRKSLLLIS